MAPFQFPLCCCNKPCDKKKLGVQRVCFLLKVVDHHKGEPIKDPKTKTMKEHCLLTCFQTHAHSAMFLIQPKLQDGATQSGLGSPISLANRDSIPCTSRHFHPLGLLHYERKPSCPCYCSMHLQWMLQYVLVAPFQYFTSTTGGRRDGLHSQQFFKHGLISKIYK